MTIIENLFVHVTTSDDIGTSFVSAFSDYIDFEKGCDRCEICNNLGCRVYENARFCFFKESVTLLGFCDSRLKRNNKDRVEPVLAPSYSFLSHRIPTFAIEW